MMDPPKTPNGSICSNKFGSFANEVTMMNGVLISSPVAPTLRINSTMSNIDTKANKQIIQKTT